STSPCCAISSLALISSSSPLATIMTFAPSAASRPAASRPMPLLDPVITATLPSYPKSICSPPCILSSQIDVMMDVRHIFKIIQCFDQLFKLLQCFIVQVHFVLGNHCMFRNLIFIDTHFIERPFHFMKTLGICIYNCIPVLFSDILYVHIVLHQIHHRLF